MRKLVLPCFLAFLLPLGCASLRAAKPAEQVASDSRSPPQSGLLPESHPPSRGCHGSKFRFK